MAEQFQRIVVGRVTWLTRAPDDVLMPVLRDPESFLSDRSQYIKSSKVVTIIRVPPNFILRRLNYGKLLHRLRDSIRSSRAVRALIASTWLEAANIPTPRAFAAGEARSLLFPRAAYLITEEIGSARTLASLFAGKQRIPSGLPELIARLHNRGLSHRDLKWTNILFDEKFSPWLIDLDGVRRLKLVGDSRAREDLLSLARCFLAYPKTLKWSGSRFLYRYCAQREPKVPFRSWTEALLDDLQSPS